MRSVVIGTGFIGPVHVEGLKRAGVDVAGIVGSTIEKTRRACEELQLHEIYPSLDEVLRDPDIDVVHLATPNRLHFEQVTAVLNSGKHVLCEKPLAMTSNESLELLELSRRSGKVAGVAYNIRFYPICHEVSARFAKGDLGTLLHVSGAYVQDWLLYENDYNWRVLANSGGRLRAVADIGTHWLDLIQFVTGSKLTSVFADLQTVHRQRRKPVGEVRTFSDGQSDDSDTISVPIETDDAANLLLRFDNGAKGSLCVSQTTAGRKNCLRFEIAGSESACAWNSESPNELWIGHRNRANELLTRDPSLMDSFAASVSSYPGGHNEGFPDSFKQLFRSFYGYIDSCEKGEQEIGADCPFPTFDDGHREVQICEAVLKSHQEQRWINISGNP